MKLPIITTTTAITALSWLTPVRAENLQHTSQLLATGQCPNCDLSRAGLAMANLSGANLEGADLSYANLSQANLMGANLMGANLTGTSLNGANLSGAVLVGANLLGTDLRAAYLVDANLLGTNLQQAYIQGTYGIPNYAGTKENFYTWGALEAERGNYQAAIAYYNQALSLDSEFAPAYLGRGVSFFRLGNYGAAMHDAQLAQMLFEGQDNATGLEVTEKFAEVIELAANPPDRGGGGGGNFGNFLAGVGSLLLNLVF
ncbi:MAG: pentapeptide repeat-containing protein [Jaaginema sp. PMC 1080.18]|nr:pentapeptide repeat-containing protein [Jaaginema sp. PMC 1080.18]MEC4867290.1 pentapeptide repeat-containing protein [Jaaginema sp. PMC 1078.18]